MNLCLAKCYPSFKPQLDIALFIPLSFGDVALPTVGSGVRLPAPPLANCVTFSIFL